MNAGLILRHLINPLLGSELVNEHGVAMTACAQLRDGAAAGLAYKSAGYAHRKRELVHVRIASVTVVATEPVMGMDVGGKGLGWSLKGTFQNRVALEAAILRTQRQAYYKETSQEWFHRKYPRIENTDK